jgi:hypothetical protein
MVNAYIIKCHVNVHYDLCYKKRLTVYISPRVVVALENLCYDRQFTYAEGSHDRGHG